MARNKYPEITVEKILDVSQRLFLEKGYDKTTIQDIVDELGGLSKGAIYHHFKSKEEIMDALGDKMFFNNNPFVPASSVPNILMVALALRRISAFMSERVFAPLAVISSKSVSTNFSRSFADRPSSHDVMAS